MPWHDGAFRTLWERRDTLPHALLLHGRQGIGKLEFALALIHGLLCEQPTASGACGRCLACVWLATGSHPDFRRLEPITEADSEEEGAPTKKNVQIGVEQVRTMSEFLSVSTHRGGWRPVLVHPAEALNVSAANALLKNLEEPPARTLFVLVSHRLHQVLPTIKSRCQLLALPAPTHDEAARWLQAKGTPDAAVASAYCGGAPLLAAVLASENQWAQRTRFLAHLGGARLEPLAAADDSEDAGYALALAWLQKWTYDVAACALTGQVRYNVDQESAIRRIAGRCDPVRTLRFHRELLRQQRHAHHPLNARLALEQLFMNYSAAVAGTPTSRA